MNYLIIGNSAAAVGAVEAIRTVDTSNPITILTEENYLAYSRPLIAEYLSDTVAVNKMWYRDGAFYSDNNVSLKLATKVISVDPEKQIVMTSEGNEIPYDKLLIASGGKPFIPPIEGLDTEGVFTFVRWDEVKKIKNSKPDIKNALVIGGGLIGLKAAEHLTKAGIKVTVVELANNILSLILDNTASNMLKRHFQEHGVDIITEKTVKRINSTDGKVSGALLSDNTLIDCDAVIIAIGVVPNNSFVENTTVGINKGIIVNEYLQTNISNIYAAGDVAEGKDLLLNTNRVLPIWPVAFKQGYTAGLNMAGVEAIYKGAISMNALEFFHLPIICAGLAKCPDESYEEEFVLNEKKKFYKKIITKNNQLVGYIYFNNIERAGILTSLITDKTDISLFKSEILNDSFGLIHIPEEIINKKLSYMLNQQAKEY